MASQVLSGSNNVSYTNNTGQNVRIVINYMRAGARIVPSTDSRQPGSLRIPYISLSWAGVSINADTSAIGRNLAFTSIAKSDRFSITGNNMHNSPKFYTANDVGGSVGNIDLGELYGGDSSLPTELMLAPNQTFSAVCGVYNIVVIPEAG